MNRFAIVGAAATTACKIYSRCLAGVWRKASLGARLFATTAVSNLTGWHAAKRCLGGMPIPRMALLQFRGDWECISKVFRFRSPGATELCWRCDATTTPGPLCYLDYDYGRCIASRVTHRDYIMICVSAARNVSMLFRSPGFVFELISIDLMHTMDLGVLADCLGSLFWIEATWKSVHRNKMLGFDALNAMLQTYYLANPSLGPLTLVGSIVRGNRPGYPFLKCKAAQARHLAVFGKHLAWMHANGDAVRPPFSSLKLRASGASQYRTSVYNLFAAVVDVDVAIDATDEMYDASVAKATITTILYEFKTLSNLWRAGAPTAAQKRMPWHNRQKGHMMRHLTTEQLMTWGSPRKSWCYNDESYMLALKRVCRWSKHVSTLETTCLDKLRIWQSVLYWKSRH